MFAYMCIRAVTVPLGFPGTYAPSSRAQGMRITSNQWVPNVVSASTPTRLKVRLVTM